VVTIEFHEKLALKAKSRLTDLDIRNVRFFAGEGTDFDGPLGMFDVIVVYAACYTRPLSLLKLLRPDGRLSSRWGLSTSSRSPSPLTT
jgi:protein-L-isoaspartate O-methyltransferase